MFGLEFQVKNEKNNFLYKILRNVNVLTYEWEIITDDTIDYENLNIDQGLLCSNVVDGESFFKSIIKEKYYMIFVDVKAFPKNSTHEKIVTVKEFLESDCQMILLCVDSEFIEFYCKEKLIYDTVYHNCIEFSFENIEDISMENNCDRLVIAF